MARRRGLSEKTFFAYNPLPLTTDADVLKRAGLDDLMEPANPLPFHITWPYGGTLEKETVRLPPQEYFMLRESECADFVKAFGEQGMVILEDPDDPKEIKAKSLAGLQKALTYWNRIGAKRLVELRKTHGFSKEEMGDFRAEHWIYYSNQAKAEFVAEEMKRLRKPTK